MNKRDITVIICCAGMGTRLGIGSTKALVNVSGKPLIIRQLEMLDEYDDIRIVVGYQAEKVIEIVNGYRKDVMFAFNYNYETTGVAASLSKGLIGARKYVVCMDGDLLINVEDFKGFMEADSECLGISNITSDEPILTKVEQKKVVAFSKEGTYCWSGLAKIGSSKLKTLNTHVFEMIAPLLPLAAVFTRSREIDTQDDYERAIEWFEKGSVD